MHQVSAPNASIIELTFPRCFMFSQYQLPAVDIQPYRGTQSDQHRKAKVLIVCNNFCLLVYVQCACTGEHYATFANNFSEMRESHYTISAI